MTEYLLDTHSLLWLSTDDERLTEAVRRVVLDTGNELWVSVASVWEMAIKKSLGKLKLSTTLERFLVGQQESLGFHLLAIHSGDALGVERLPFHHRDPFDRLLVAQARHRDLTILSRDPRLLLYHVDVFWGDAVP